MSSSHGHGESPPSARPSMTAPPDQGPLALFDLYLRILSDSYLTFLHERFARPSSLALVWLSPDLFFFLAGRGSRKTSQSLRSPPSSLSIAYRPHSYESLVELHRKTLNVDQFFDSRLETTTLRSAWSEVRDNVEREAQTRRAFMDSITHEVISPLISFKVSLSFWLMSLSRKP
jgi:hypothetical protein